MCVFVIVHTVVSPLWLSIYYVSDEDDGDPEAWVQGQPIVAL